MKNVGEKMAQAQTLKVSECPEKLEDLKNRDFLTVKELLCSSIWAELSHSQRTLVKFLQHLKSVLYRRTIKIYIEKESKYLKITTYKSTFEVDKEIMLFKRVNALGETVIDIALIEPEKVDFLIDFINDFIEKNLLTDKEIVIHKYVLDYLT